MKTRVIGASKSTPFCDKDYDFILQQDNWNDFSFYTSYHLYFSGGSPSDTSTVYIGGVKIIKKGQMAGDPLQVKLGYFESLDSDYCSIGQSLDYYKRISELDDNLKIKILESLRDVNVIDAHEFKGEPAWIKSVMRDISEDDDIFHLPKFIIESNYSDIPSVDLNFSFFSDKMVKPLSFDFDSKRYGWNEKLPGRISVLVGQNGCGKSTLLARMSRVAFASTQDRKNEKLLTLGHFEPQGLNNCSE